MTNKKTQFGTKAALNGPMPKWARITGGVMLLLIAFIHQGVTNDSSIPREVADSVITWTDAAGILIVGVLNLIGVTYQNQE